MLIWFIICVCLCSGTTVSGKCLASITTKYQLSPRRVDRDLQQLLILLPVLFSVIFAW